MAWQEIGFQNPDGTQNYACTSSDTKLTSGIVAGSKCFETDTDSVFQLNGSAWVQISTNGAAFVTDFPPMIPVVSTVGGTAQALKQCDSGAANLFMGFRAVADAGDDSVAGDSLSSGQGAKSASRDGEIEFWIPEGTTRVDVVGIMNGSATGGCIDQGDTSANAIAQMTQFDFSETVHRIVVTCTYDLTGRYAEITVGGYRNA